MKTNKSVTNHLLISKLRKQYPNIFLTEKKEGYQLEDNEKKMSFILIIDEYINIIKQNNKHIFNKIFKKNNLEILDCTGGFARDASIIASLGNKVTLIEENPLIMLILKNAISKITNDEIRDNFKNIKTKFGNSLDYLRESKQKFDYIYLDFMFNVNKKTLPNKREQFLRMITKNDIEANKDMVKEIIQRTNSKIIIKEHIKSNDYKIFNIVNTYKERIVKYNLIDSNNGY